MKVTITKKLKSIKLLMIINIVVNNQISAKILANNDINENSHELTAMSWMIRLTSLL